MISIPAGLALVLAGVLYWMLDSESGARWLWSRASASVPGSLGAGELHGDLRSGLTLKAFAFENESISITSPNVKLQLGLGLFPVSLSIESLDADQLDIKQLSAPEAAPGDSPEDLLSSLSLPVPVDLNSIRIGRMIYRDEQGATRFESSNLYFSGRWQEDLLIRQAGLKTPAAEWSARARIGFRPPFPLDANLETRMDPAAVEIPSASPVQLKARLKGDLGDLEIEAQADRPAVTLRGRIRDLLQQPGWDLQLLAGELQWPLESDAPDVVVAQLAANSSGRLRHYELHAAGTVGINGMPVMPFDLKGNGNAQSILIDKLHLSGEQLRLEARGPVSWNDGMRIDLSSVIERFDPGLWLASWPKDRPLNGDLELGWEPGHLTLRSFNLAERDDGFSLLGSGDMDLATDVVEAALEWNQFRWPPAGGLADVSSRNGNVRVHGKPRDWSLEGSLQLQAGQWPDGLLTLTGNGDLGSMRLQVERGETLGGLFDGQFSFGWTGQRDWSADVRAQKLDIASLDDRLPTAVSGTFSAAGRLQPMEFDVDIKQMSGALRGRRIDVDGGVSLAGGQLHAKALQIRSGESHLLLDGDMKSSGGIRFFAHVESMDELVPGTSGSFEGQGRFSSNPAHPLFELDLRGSDLSWGAWRIGAISTSRPEDQGEFAATRFELTDITFDGQTVDEIGLTLSGQKPLDTIQLEGRRNGTRLEASLAGSVTGWDNPAVAGWTGEINAINLENEALGSLNLEKPASLVVGLNGLEAGPACLSGSRNGQICFDFRWRDGNDFQAHSRLDTISLHLLPLLLDTNVEFTETLSGEFFWQKSPGEKLTAELKAELSPGEIRIEDEEVALSTGPGLFAFRITDGQLLTAVLKIDIPGAGSVDGEFRALDISLGVDSAIDGHIRLEFGRIEPLLKWIPLPVDRISGNVNADIRLSGTFSDAKLTGHASLVRGEVEYGASGTVVSDITLAGAVYEFDYTELNGSFRMGDGRGVIKAAVHFDDILNPEIQLEFSGQNLTLVNVPDVTVKANPDLELHWHDGLLNLNGSILVPSARISPRYLPSPTASESDDLVITGGGDTLPEESFDSRSKLRLNGTVAVELGKDVSVTLERATASLRGKVAFNWNDNILPVADGMYALSGEITAYGQRLKIDDGRISFPHIPADDPHLNISAVREIYGNQQVREAGVLISGTLRRPVLEPYTMPATTRERALTLLVTGHDFDYEQGVGGVEVGMYIAPRFYVSYGIGLFESQSVISARYDLKHGFGIKATSGQRQTGADISYTIER